jgi:hypothetical protein
MQLDDGGLLSRWRDIKDTFEPNNVARWVDDSVIKYAAKWLEEHKGLCWVEHREFGLKLAETSGLPFFYGQSKKDIDGYSGPAILSIKSMGEGQNLQDRWSKNLVVSHPPNGQAWEQTLGRTHRYGQESDDVEVYVPMVTIEQWLEFQKALRSAEYIERTTRLPQKLMYATKDIPHQREIDKLAERDYLWQS